MQRSKADDLAAWLATDARVQGIGRFRHFVEESRAERAAERAPRPARLALVSVREVCAQYRARSQRGKSRASVAGMSEGVDGRSPRVEWEEGGGREVRAGLRRGLGVQGAASPAARASVGNGPHPGEGGRMNQWFFALHPVLQALLAGLFTWSITAVGAAAVFLTRQVNRRLLDAMLGFSGGVMLAASNWSLLAPAIEISAHGPTPAWFPPTAGFLLGGATLWILDKSLPHLHLGFRLDEAEGPATASRRVILLVSAITLHNIPEGLAVGVAFGGVIGGLSSIDVTAALVLSLGIGMQNLPEGIAVALPLRGEGMSRMKSFGYGQLSALVEPLAAMIGAASVVVAAPILPYALSFAAGAMVYVVVEELIPESHRAGNVDLATVSLMAGFAVMMILDVGLG